MTAPRIQRDHVLEALSPRRVIEAFKIDGRIAGHEWRTRLCPACGPRARDAVAINLSSGRWIDHAHGCCGDLLALIAAAAGLDARTQFGEVLAIAAELAGVAPSATSSPESRDRQRREREHAATQARTDELAARAARRAAAIAHATSVWDESAMRSDAGEAYLVERGVRDVLGLGLVRFTRGGHIAIALHTADGKIVNVVQRRIDGGEPKVRGLKDCPTAGTFIDSISDIEHRRPVVLVEGAFDAITARLAWPSAVVLGAHGASNLPKIAAAAAPRVRLADTALLVVPHGDAAGELFCTEAVKRAIGAGLRARTTLQVVNCGAKDLNDAWRGGWRAAQ